MPQKAAVAIPLQFEPTESHAGMGSVDLLQDAAAHGDVELNFVYSGALRYFMGGRFVDVGAGTLSVLWGALPRRIFELHPQTELMYVRVPLVTLLRYDLPSSFVRKLLGGDVLVDAQGLGWYAELTRRWVTDHRSGEPASLRACELEIEARLRRLAARRQQRVTVATAG